MSQILVFHFLCCFAACPSPALLCETGLACIKSSWLHWGIVCRILRRLVVCATGTSTVSQVLPEPQSIPQPGTTFPANFYATKGCVSGSSGVTVLPAPLYQTVPLQQDSALPYTVDLQQPLQLEILVFSAWTELHRDYHISYWSVISLNHPQITTGKYNATSFGGKWRALPEVLSGPWDLLSSLSHQKGLLSEYRALQLCSLHGPLTCQYFQAFSSTWK